MHRIDTSGSVNGQFHDGNPNIGQLATLLGAAFMNDLQENVCYVIEEQGIALEKGKASQLSDAIVALVVGAVGDGSGAVPATRNINAGGLATGGGSLAADRTISVGKASAAEVAAGVRDDVAITPLALAGGVGARNLQAFGYATLMGGVIVQWGSTTIPGNSSRTVTLPMTFPTMCAYAGVSGGSTDAGAQDNDPNVQGRSASTITFFSARDETIAITYFAIGF